MWKIFEKKYSDTNFKEKTSVPSLFQKNFHTNKFTVLSKENINELQSYDFSKGCKH